MGLDSPGSPPSKHWHPPRLCVLRSANTAPDSGWGADPAAGGLNCERIQGAADPNMRSLRIDGSYRTIVAKPERGRSSWMPNHRRWSRVAEIELAEHEGEGARRDDLAEIQFADRNN